MRAPIIATAAPMVRIYQLARQFECWRWLCPSCLDVWLGTGWQIRAEKDPPHPVRCDDCKRTNGDHAQ